MMLWLLCFLFLGLALRDLLPILSGRFTSAARAYGGGLRIHREAGLILSRMRESLESGSLIQDSDWTRLASLPAPWSPWVVPMLREQRAQGVSMIPTLRRLGTLAEQSYQDGLSSRSKSSQGLAQAIISMCLIPILAICLYQMLPELESERGLWWMGVGMFVSLAGLGALWMMKLTENAQYLGLPSHERSTLFLAQASIERLLAGLGSGLPADIAWAKMGDLLPAYLGASLWSKHTATESHLAGQILVRFGEELRKSIQLGLLEGKPVTERIEVLSTALRSELRGEVDRKIQMLGNHLLLPLFTCVAPAAFGMLALALYLGFGQAIGGGV